MEPKRSSSVGTRTRPWLQAVWRGRYLWASLTAVLGLGLVMWFVAEMLPAVAPFVYTAF